MIAHVSVRPTLVLDFDGTVCVGDAPVWAYAEAVISGILDGTTAGELDAGIRARLGAFLDGEPGSAEYIDGYAAVAALARDHATAEQLQQAYVTSRRALADGSIPVSTPVGLGDLLRELDGRVDRVLVTNAPADGVHETLAALGIDDAIDRIITDAGKPDGWAALLPGLIDDRDAAYLLAVGDIWGNDIAAPVASGCAGALIDRFGHRAGPANVTAATFEELYPSVREWASDPMGFVAAHPPTRAESGPSVSSDPSAARPGKGLNNPEPDLDDDPAHDPQRIGTP